MLFSKRVLGTVAYLGGLPAVLEEFLWSWGQMVQYNAEYTEPGTVVHYDRATMSLHDFARNTLAQRMIGEWLVMFDTDHRFDPDIVMRLVAGLDLYSCDVLSAVYVQKRPPHSPVIYQGSATDGMQPIAKWRKGISAFEIASAGGGTFIARRSVFDRIRAELKEGPFDRLHPYGEDHSFFLRVSKLGLRAMAAPVIESHHLQIVPRSLEDHVIPPGAVMQSGPTVGGYAQGGKACR